ncbi:MAG TPA: histidine kinase dimerization/phospho-acceptor domain-containing protein, partial [Spirochaetota bacterium]
MRKRFARKIIFLYATFITGIILFLLLFFNNLIYDAHLSIIKREMDEKGNFVEQIFREEHASPDKPDSITRAAKTAAGIINLRLTVINSDGRVISDSEVPDVSLMENHLYRPEIQDSRENKMGFHIRRSATVKTDMLYCAKKYGSVYIRLAKPLHEIDASIAILRRGVLTAGTVLAIGTLLLIILVSRRLAKPIAETGEFATQFASGNFDRRILNYSDDEIGSVQRALNAMADTLVGTINDLRSGQEKLRTTLETIPDGIALVAPDGKISFSNKAFADIFALSVSPVGRLHFEIIRSREINLELEAILKNGTPPRPEEISLGDRIFELFLNRVREGDAQHSALLLLHDITEQKKMERIKSELVGNMSHELKTPIAIMRGYLETIRESTQPNEQIRQFIDKAIENADRQNSLITDILKLHLMESSTEFPREEIHLDSIIDSIITLIKPKAAEKEISFSVHTEDLKRRIPGNRFLAEEIFFNLIDNAVNYNNPHGSVTIRSERGEKSILIHVEDTGIGIPSDSIDRIFERFYRVDKSRSRAT